MPICPVDHYSVRLDFCDVCGRPIEPRTPAPSLGAPDPPAEPCPQCGTGRLGQFCEACGFDFVSGMARPSWAFSSPAFVPNGDSRTTPSTTLLPRTSLAVATPPSASVLPSAALTGGDPGVGSGPAAGPASLGRASWVAVVTADRGYFDTIVAAGAPDAGTIRFPLYCPERRFRLAGREMRIGRRSASRGIEPEIDLTGPPTDPGISHLHAVLLAEPDGGWSVLDPGSSNGTQLNGREVPTGQRVPLRDGDQIGLGAWTVLTVRAG
jgi:FHA domain-containing protein